MFGIEQLKIFLYFYTLQKIINIYTMSARFGKVLIIDDNEDILFSLKLLLKQHVELVDTFNNPELLPDLIKKENYDVILLDMNYTKDAISGQEGFNCLQKILDIDPDAVVIFITAYGDAEKAVKAIKSGATDFISKPWQNEKLIATISSGIRLRRSKIENTTLRSTQKELIASLDQPFNEFIGRSSQMLSVFNTIQKVAKTDANVLILGENGTGKELVARALHRNSAKCDEVFISVDLGSITETLFESELFGHEKGSFTDAKSQKLGRFEIASKGTLFLDEVGNISIPFQAKLLTVLERREITRVGAVKPIPIDVRLICATNIDIHENVRKNLFRQDLLYRINTVEISLPPLRERDGDVELLAEHFFAQYSKKYKKNLRGISSASMKKLNAYNWPGNVRELQHSIERAIILSESNYLEPDDFMLSSSAKRLQDSAGFDTSNLENIEKQVIVKVLKQHQGNITLAAKDLGLTRASLYRRMEKYGL
jgi:DNA-binding NtrC family response regulator